MSPYKEWDEVLREYDKNYHTLESARMSYFGFAKDLFSDMKNSLAKDDSVKALCVDGLTIEHLCYENNADLPHFLKSTINIVKTVPWFEVIARLATPWAKGKDVSPGMLHIGVKYLLDKKKWEWVRKIPSFTPEISETSIRQFGGKNVVKEKGRDYDELDEWIYLEEFELTYPLNRNGLMTGYKNVLKNAVKCVFVDYAPIQKAYRSLLKAYDSVNKNPIIQSGQELKPEEEGLKTVYWDYPYIQVNTCKNKPEHGNTPNIWIYVDTDETNVCFGLSKDSENGDRFGPLNKGFLEKLRKVNSDFKENNDIDGFECGTLVNKDSLEKNSIDQTAEVIEKALRIYGESVDETR